MHRTTFALAVLATTWLGVVPSLGVASQVGASSVNDDLAKAVAHGDEAAASTAVERGADLNGFTRRYRPYNILCSFVWENDIRAARILLELGASPGVGCFLGKTPLLLATENKNAEMISLLLAHGAPIDVIDEYGFTPLGSALSGEGRQRDAVRILRRHGASRGDIYDIYLAMNMLAGVNMPIEQGQSTGTLWGLRPEAALMRPFASMGWGAYAEVVTHSWQDVSLGGGLLLVPTFWMVPSVGVYTRHAGEAGWTPGVAVGLFLGRHLSNTEKPPGRFGGTPPTTEVFAKLDFGARVDGHWGKAATDRSIALMLQMDLDYLWIIPCQFLAAAALH